MNSPKLNCIIASLVVLVGCLTGQRVAFAEAGVAGDESAPLAIGRLSNRSFFRQSSCRR
jgi:hypothetical protein